jgi:hypothetical protein
MITSATPPSTPPAALGQKQPFTKDLILSLE